MNGLAAAAVSDLANKIPNVAYNPTIVAPRPTKFTVSPVDSCRTTSARGGTRLSCSADFLSLSPSLTIPSDQNVVKNDAQMPNRMKYRPASVAFVIPLNKNEKTRITALTVVRTSCPQNPNRPSFLHASAVRATFFDICAVDSSAAARVTTPRRRRVVVVVVVVVVVAAAGADGRSATASPLNAAARDARTNLRESDATTNFYASATHGVRRAAREPEARITAGARSDTAAVVRDAIVSGCDERFGATRDDECGDASPVGSFTRRIDRSAVHAADWASYDFHLGQLVYSPGRSSSILHVAVSTTPPARTIHRARAG